MPNPFQIDMDMHTDIPKTKIPISSKTSIKLTISKHHNFALKTAQNSSNDGVALVKLAVDQNHVDGRAQT